MKKMKMDKEERNPIHLLEYKILYNYIIEIGILDER
jgi:hypothetical protein